MSAIEKIDWLRCPLRGIVIFWAIQHETYGFPFAAGGMGDRPGSVGFASAKRASHSLRSGRRGRGGLGSVPCRALSHPTKGKRVTPLAVPALSETAVALCILFILLVPFAGAGLSLINTGLGRSRSAAHSMLASLCVIAVAALVYLVCGFAWQGFIGRPGHVLNLAGKTWNWIAFEPLFLRGLKLDGSPASLAVWLQMLSVGLAAQIPLGSGADRWKL